MMATKRCLPPVSDPQQKREKGHSNYYYCLKLRKITASFDLNPGENYFSHLHVACIQRVVVVVMADP